MTIVAIKRRLVFILHLEEKYAKKDCKNENYVKNWVRSTWTAKVNYGKKVNPQSKSPVKVNEPVNKKSTQVNSQSMMTSADVAGDVSRLDDDVSR